MNKKPELLATTTTEPQIIIGATPSIESQQITKEEKTTFVLDVGCGVRHMGDVNVDLDRSVKPDVVCDATFLPFKCSVFRVVFASHVLEHLVNPVCALIEWKRVSKSFVVIWVPNLALHRYDECRKFPHLYSWNATTLRNLLNNVFPSVKVKGWFYPHVHRKFWTALKFYLLILFLDVPELQAVCRVGTPFLKEMR